MFPIYMGIYMDLNELFDVNIPALYIAVFYCVDCDTAFKMLGQRNAKKPVYKYKKLRKYWQKEFGLKAVYMG